MLHLAQPSHPGMFIKMEIVEALSLSVTRAAILLGVTRQALSTLLNGHADLSPDMALRLEKAFGVKMDTLLRMQTAYDISIARAGEKKIKVRRYLPQNDEKSKAL